MAPLEIPDPSLVVLVGPAAAGKTTFALRHFYPEEVVSTDRCRLMLTATENFDEETNQRVFDLFHELIEQRLCAGKLAVADSTALLPIARRNLLACAAKYDIPVVALLFQTSFQTCLRNDASRPRQVGKRIIDEMFQSLDEVRESISREDFEIYCELSDQRRRLGRIQRRQWSWFPKA